MAIWKRKKKETEKDAAGSEIKREGVEEDNPTLTDPAARKETGIEEPSEAEVLLKEKDADLSIVKSEGVEEADYTLAVPVAGSTTSEEVALEQTGIEELSEVTFLPRDDLRSGVILRDKQISGKFGRVFWGLISIFVLPPVLMFAFGILIIVFMLIFPILAVILVTFVPVVFVTLSVLIIAFPVVFPLLVLFLLITGKGRLLVASEGRWIGIEMFGKSYSLK
ncbi:MAG: hypothetical protein NUV76_05405 [Candidatus Kuenenia sp.]|nr:hypothetical protein [Candidatus Kuenenia sp.]